MKIETQPRDDHQVTLIVEVEAERMESAKHRAARRISERKSIPGFRPGKAPYDVVVRSFGEGIIKEEAVDLLLDEIYPEALQETRLNPSGPGKVDKIDDLDMPKFTFIVPLMPTVDLGNYRSVRLPYEWSAPGEDKVDESIEELRRMHSKTETVDRPIETGDFVLIDLKGMDVKASEDKVPIIDRPGYPVFVRSDGKTDEWPYSGFSNELIGLRAEEGKSFVHKYRKDFSDDLFRGLTVKFLVIVKTVRSVILPEINDEFSKTVGNFTDVQSLRTAIHSNLEMQSKADYDDKYFIQLMDKIKEGAILKFPPQILDHEVELVLKDLKGRLTEQGLDMDTYLKTRQMDEVKFVSEEVKPMAIHRLERSLIMEEVARAEKIEISDETLRSNFQQTLEEVQGSAAFKKTMRGKTQPTKRLMDAIAMETANRAITKQTLERLKEIAIGLAPELPVDEKTTKPAKKSTRRKADRLNSARAVPSPNGLITPSESTPATVTEKSVKAKKPVTIKKTIGKK